MHRAIIYLLFSLLSTTLWASVAFQYDQTDGSGFIGIGYYTETYNVSLSLSGLDYNDGPETSYLTPFLFAEMKSSITDQSYLGYGLNYHQTFGKENDKDIRDYSIGPHVSFGHMLGENLLLSAWVDPVEYRFEGRKSQGTTTGNSMYAFGSGGFRLGYLF